MTIWSLYTISVCTFLAQVHLLNIYFIKTRSDLVIISSYSNNKIQTDKFIALRQAASPRLYVQLPLKMVTE